MKIVPLISFGLSIVLCVCATAIALSGNGTAEARIERPIAEPVIIEPDLAQIVTAAVDIDASTQLSRDMLTLTDWPADRLPSGAITDVAQIAFGSELTPYTNGVIVQGEPLLHSKLVVHPPRRLLSQVVPDGMRAISIPVNDDTAVSGLVLPGDHVDVNAFVRTRNEKRDDTYSGRVIVRGALVLAADQTFSQVVEGALPANTVTLALTPANATRVMAAARSHELGLALIGREELDRRAAEPARVVRKPAVRRAAAPARPAAPKTREITVILGDRETSTTAPVERREPAR
ncbi:MAG: Flp pilus assembly protein CpaB [Pseudomonadota bacterium]